MRSDLSLIKSRTLHSKVLIFVASQLLKSDQRDCCLDEDTRRMPFGKDPSSFCDWLVGVRGGSLLLMLKRVLNALIFAVIVRERLSQRLDFPETVLQRVNCF